jgi:hypothetical protein
MTPGPSEITCPTRWPNYGKAAYINFEMFRQTASKSTRTPTRAIYPTMGSNAICITARGSTIKAYPLTYCVPERVVGNHLHAE